MSILGHPASGPVIAAAIEVHQTLGPGLLESVYQGCLAYELLQRGVRFRREVAIPVQYKGASLECGYRADLLVEDDLIVEVKSVESLQPIHIAQVLTHLKLSGARQALLLNFGQIRLKDGLRSFLGYENEVPINRGVG
jgi:GxxExxY protein